MMEHSLRYSRREFGGLVLAGVPLSLAALSAAAKINSTFGGVTVGAISYSFRTLTTLDDILKAMTTIGLGEVELMSNHAEAAIGAPSVQGPPRGAGGPPPGGPSQMTPEQRTAFQAAQKERAEALRKWRAGVSIDKFKEVRK